MCSLSLCHRKSHVGRIRHTLRHSHCFSNSHEYHGHNSRVRHRQLEGRGLEDVLYVPGQEAYDARINSYWFLTPRLKPWAIVQPWNTEEVASAVKALLKTHNCNFAVRRSAVAWFIHLRKLADGGSMIAAVTCAHRVSIILEQAWPSIWGLWQRRLTIRKLSWHRCSLVSDGHVFTSTLKSVCGISLILFIPAFNLLFIYRLGLLTDKD
jgi:hypothetical protein